LSSQKDNELEINKGTELMLRRDKKENTPEKNGVIINHKLTLLKRIFNFNLEFTWEVLKE